MVDKPGTTFSRRTETVMDSMVSMSDRDDLESTLNLKNTHALKEI